MTTQEVILSMEEVTKVYGSGVTAVTALDNVSLQTHAGEIVLVNAYIPEYAGANRFNHEPRRIRKILLHRRQIDRLIAAVQREGRTLIPVKLYFDEKGRAKLELALAKGKKAHDKRATEAERDWKRDQARLLRDRG